MERQELSIHNVIDSRRYNGASRLVLFFLAVLFFFCVHSYASCLYRDYTCGTRDQNALCKDGAFYRPLRCAGGIGGNIEETGCSSSFPGTAIVSLQCTGTPDGNGYQILKATCVVCSSAREKDSVLCVRAGNAWTSDGDGFCDEPCPVDDVCGSYESACLAESGHFTKNCLRVDGNACCQGVCNVCNGAAMEKLYNMKVSQCCEQGLAPPDKDRVCYTQGIGAGCGVSWSQYRELSSGEWACQSPGLSVEAAIRYRELCFSESSSSSDVESSASGTSSGGGSSGESLSSSGGTGQYPEGCDECPWLDSILDTLTMQKKVVENIENCIKYPSLCGQENKQDFQGDTSILPHLRPFLDSSVKLSRENLDALSRLDTSVLKILDTLSKVSKSDTPVVMAINGAASTIDGKLVELLAKFSPGAIDTNGLGVWASYMRSGENKADSIVNSSGWSNLKNLNVDSNYSAALGGLSNKADSMASVVDDSLSNLAGRLKDSLVRLNTSLKQKLPDTLSKYADSLVIWAPFADFDSIIYSTLGTRIPNTDECPEDCQRWTVNIPIIGLVNYTVDYGLCLGRASLGNLSVLAFIKLLIRIIVAITCVMIIYRALIGLK